VRETNQARLLGLQGRYLLLERVSKGGLEAAQTDVCGQEEAIADVCGGDRVGDFFSRRTFFRNKFISINLFIKN
jgi:hypothetical protein